MGFDLSSNINWNTNIDDKLFDLKIKNHKNEVKDLLIRIRSLVQL